MLSTVRPSSDTHTAAPERCKSATLTGDDDEVFMTRNLNVTPKTTEQHLIVRSCKSEAKVTIIKDCARGTDGHEASRGLSATKS